MFKSVFRSRTGWKSYLFVMPIALLLVLSLKFFWFVFSLLLAGCIASRLNDIGWWRWHCIWLTAWALFVKLVFSGVLQDGHMTLDERGALGLVELPLFLLLLIIAFVSGQKETNSFGPKPISFREFIKGRKTTNQFKRAYRMNEIESRTLSQQLNIQLEKIKELSEQFQKDVKLAGENVANVDRSELDAAYLSFYQTKAKCDEVRSRWEPSQVGHEQWMRRQSEILNYRKNRNSLAA